MNYYYDVCDKAEELVRMLAEVRIVDAADDVTEGAGVGIAVSIDEGDYVVCVQRREPYDENHIRVFAVHYAHLRDHPRA